MNHERGPARRGVRPEARGIEAEVAFLLEDVADPGVDWRYRLRIHDGRSSGWVDVEGTGRPPTPRAARALVLARADELGPTAGVSQLESLSPLVTNAPVP